jgi:hypothetical protein
MSLRTWPGLALFCLVCAASVWAAEVTWDSEFENTLFNTPKGWATTQRGGSMLVVPTDLRLGEEAAIVVTPGAKLTGDFKDAFNQLRGDLRGKVTAKESAVQSATADEGYPCLYVAEELQDSKGHPKQFRFCFGSNPDKDLELVMLVANTQDAYNRYMPAFQEFLKTLAYKSARPGAHATSGPATAPSP